MGPGSKSPTCRCGADGYQAAALGRPWAPSTQMWVPLIQLARSESKNATTQRPPRVCQDGRTGELWAAFVDQRGVTINKWQFVSLLAVLVTLVAVLIAAFAP